MWLFHPSLLISVNSIYCVRSWSLSSVASSPVDLAIPYVNPLASIFLTCSVYTVVAITVERYATIRQCHSRIFSTRALIFFVIFISVSYNFIKFFDHTVDIAANVALKGNVSLKPFGRIFFVL